MSDEFNLIAEFREDQGKGASRRLRREGKVPAIVYGAGRPSRSVCFDHNKVIRQLENESFYSSVLQIKVGDKSQSVIVKDIQRHPSRPIIMHMDFQRIVDDVEIKMNVPLHFVGGDVAPGVKLGGGTVSQIMNDVEISCLPKNLPEYLEVDISELELDAMLHLSDIKLPEGVNLTALMHDDEHDHDLAVVSVLPPRVEVEPVEEEAEETEAAAAEEGAEEATEDEEQG